MVSGVARLQTLERGSPANGWAGASPTRSGFWASHPRLPVNLTTSAVPFPPPRQLPAAALVPGQRQRRPGGPDPGPRLAGPRELRRCRLMQHDCRTTRPPLHQPLVMISLWWRDAGKITRCGRALNWMSQIWAVGEGKVLRWRGLFLCCSVEVDVDLTEPPHSKSSSPGLTRGPNKILGSIGPPG